MAENTPVDTPQPVPDAPAWNLPSWSLPSSGYGPAISAAGSGAEALAALAQGIQAAKRARAAAAYNADVLKANSQAQVQAAEIEAQQYERNAALAIQHQLQEEMLLGNALAYQEARQREQDARIIGQTRAIIGASGLMMSGSPMRVLEETARQQELDILATRYTAEVQLRTSRAATDEQVTQARYAAQLARYGGAERLRVGGAQRGLLRAETDTSQVSAGLLRAGASLTQGAATFNYLNERQKSQSLLGAPRSGRDLD